MSEQTSNPTGTIGRSMTEIECIAAAIVVEAERRTKIEAPLRARIAELEGEVARLREALEAAESALLEEYDCYMEDDPTMDIADANVRVRLMIAAALKPTHAEGDGDGT